MKSIVPHYPDPRQNQLLAVLPDEEWARWRQQLEPVELVVDEVICAACKGPGHLYFPTTASVSLLYTTREGASSEIAVVGNDGLVGISLFMGGEAMLSHAVVQHAGQGYRLSARVLKDEVGRSSAVLGMLLGYAQSMMGQIAQTAVCNRYHSIDQQLCRRLLVGLDHLSSDQLVMTHGLLGRLLGVRREGVTAAALKLQRAGVISYSRGRIDILDRKRLEQCSCECYAVGKKKFARFTPLPLAA